MINTIYLGADHGGFELKQTIKSYLSKNPGYEIVDLGTGSEDSVDYPEYGKVVGEAVVQNPESVGIVICGSGVGISIAANKVPGVRCGLSNSVELARLSREHNGANVLALGARTSFYDSVEDIVSTFLDTPLDSAQRHARRREQLDEL